MAHPEFVHLRVHTAFSLSEGAIRVKELAKACAEKAMPAVAMTDTATLAGAAVFTKEATGKGVQPIMGAQILLAHPPCCDAEAAASKIVLLAKDTAGYANLVRLISLAHLGSEDGGDPSVDLKQLKAHADGLIALTGGPEGPVDGALRLGHPERARQRMQAFAMIFGDRAYCEVQRHGLESEARTEPELIALADEIGLPLVATNDCYFLERETHGAHDVLLAIAERTYLTAEERRRVTPEHYFKSAQEMAALFADLPDAVSNTVEIAKRCAVCFENAQPMLPAYPDLAEGKTEAEELRDQAADGLEDRFRLLATTEDDKPAYRERLDYELGVIEQMGFPGYFLIVSDFIKWAKAQGIPVGPGRGSGAGSLVAYSLQITDLDPLRYGLLFERFLNPDRVSMPDFDVDFCQERRDEVIDYCRERYGADRVCQIGTFGSLKARAAFKAVCRAMQIPYPVAERWSKMIPNNPADPKTIPEALEMEPLVDELPKAEADIQEAFRVAQQIEGMYSHASTHAAGVVIADRPVAEIVPVMKDDKGAVATNYDMKAVESAGLVKFDFLGLKTLDVIEGARGMVAEAHGEVDFDRIGVDDPATYAMLQDADSFGVFQLESDGMRSAMRQIKPSNIDDVVALVSLYRPGPMENIPTYAAVKQGDQEPHYLHEQMTPILKDTYGIIIYQEQVMELARKLAGYSLGQADILRRAMGKKIQEEMDKQRQVFIDGARERGIGEDTAVAIFELINRFANYGFNKSHAAAYAVISFRTAYLKRHYPYEFYAASMNLDIHEADKLAEFVRELKREELSVRRPDVNVSKARFDVERDAGGRATAVLYALSAARGVGVNAMDRLLAEREANGRFKGIADLVDRTVGFMNKKAYEGLIHAGACDGFGLSRKAMLTALDRLIKAAQSEAKHAQSQQASMFDMMGAKPTVSVKDVPEMPKLEKLKAEFDALGVYMSGHPLEDAHGTLQANSCRTLAETLSPKAQWREVRLGALVTDLGVRSTRKGDLMAILTLSDPTGMYEAVCFPEDWERHRETLRAGEAFIFTLGISEREGMRQLLVRGAEPLKLDADLAAAAA